MVRTSHGVESPKSSRLSPPAALHSNCRDNAKRIWSSGCVPSGLSGSQYPCPSAGLSGRLLRDCLFRDCYFGPSICIRLGSDDFAEKTSPIPVLSPMFRMRSSLEITAALIWPSMTPSIRFSHAASKPTPSKDCKMSILVGGWPIRNAVPSAKSDGVRPSRGAPYSARA